MGQLVEYIRSKGYDSFDEFYQAYREDPYPPGASGLPLGTGGPGPDRCLAGTCIPDLRTKDSDLEEE